MEHPLVDCYICNQFKKRTVDEVFQHVKRTHLELPEGLPCSKDGCGFVGTSLGDSLEHLRLEHDGGKEERFPTKECPVCDKVEATREEMERHFTLSHLRTPLYACKTCDGVATFDLSEWVEHALNSHPDKKALLRVVIGE